MGNVCCAEESDEEVEEVEQKRGVDQRDLSDVESAISESESELEGKPVKKLLKPLRKALRPLRKAKKLKRLLKFL
eukprot:CAMPEP_0178446924 /NCGR_PEP_ID=MMETSP0689_2-20121128/41094_1 /TAXON_ID=160604 /ORGANISM="Amphidinium massartii, Strain CS-259" /LENGTH=74 /DNA_ID=CAMNT_0020071843 /DNA_START=81 /DNA_END=305 /DNA_ORIENTATION=+